MWNNEKSEGETFTPWTEDDIARVEALNEQEGNNHLPKTESQADTPTWEFYERYIHILEGDQDFDFADFDTERLKQVDWQEIKTATQKLRGEEPEEYDETVGLESGGNTENMRYVRDFLKSRFGKDFSIPDPDML